MSDQWFILRIGGSSALEPGLRRARAHASDFGYNDSIGTSVN